MTFPYYEYADRKMAGIVPTLVLKYKGNFSGLPREDKHYTLPERELRALIVDAWLSGLAYSFELLPETEPSVLAVRLRDKPKTFSGGKMEPVFQYCAEVG